MKISKKMLNQIEASEDELDDAVRGLIKFRDEVQQLLTATVEDWRVARARLTVAKKKIFLKEIVTLDYIANANGRVGRGTNFTFFFEILNWISQQKPGGKYMEWKGIVHNIRSTEAVMIDQNTPLLVKDVIEFENYMKGAK